MPDLPPCAARPDPVTRRGSEPPPAPAPVGAAPLDAERLVLDVLAPLQEESGRHWHQGRWAVVDSHRREALVERALGDLEVSPRSSSGHGDLLVVCPEGERHVLPARMAAEVWRRRGWQARVIGPSVPPRQVIAALAHPTTRRRPTAVVVSCTTPASLPGAARVTAAAEAVGLPVLAGGPGFGADDRRAVLVGATGWAADVVDADRLLHGWRHGAPAATGQPLDDRIGLLELEAAAVHAHLADAVPDRSAQALLHHAARVAAAREVVDDDRIVAEAVGWLTTALAGRGLPVHGPVGCLEEALRPWAPLVADLVADVATHRSASGSDVGPRRSGA